MLSSVRRLHRAMVRWVVDAFDLPARCANWRSRVQAHIAAHHRQHHRPLQHHRPRRSRVLSRWQATIGRILS
jgi:hypothetical protein